MPILGFRLATIVDVISVSRNLAKAEREFWKSERGLLCKAAKLLKALARELVSP